MARYKPYSYDQSVFVPVNLAQQIEPHTLPWIIQQLIDSEVDTSIFDGLFRNDDTGRPAYDRKVLLKIILLAYSRGITGSRRIERACRENILFLAMACGQIPDYSTIATFVSTMGTDRITSIYRDILLVCEEEGLLGQTHFSLDGVKLPSNASKQKSGTHAQLAAKAAKLEQRIKGLVRSHQRADRRDRRRPKKRRDPDEPSDEDKAHARRVRQLKQKARQIRDFLEDHDPKIGRGGTEIKSNATDNESATMATDKGVIQGYNAQAMVDDKHQVIVHADAFGNSQDHGNLEPMVDGAKENLQAIGQDEDALKDKELSADANYHNKRALQKCEDEQIDAYIPDIRFRKRDRRFTDRDKYKERHRQEHKCQSNHYTQEDFAYDQTRDCYFCPQGAELRLNARRQIRGTRIVRIYHAAEASCADCPVRSRCLIGPKGKYRSLTITLERLHPDKPQTVTQRMRAKIDRPEGRQRYEKRFGIVEPVFANIGYNKKLNRFTMRGREKVSVQWKLYCLVHNIEKLLHYGKLAPC